MTNSRIYQKATAITLIGKYIAVDKSGQSDAERYLATDILPTKIYRCNTETVGPGTTTIIFGVGTANPFPAGTDYGFAAIWAIPTDTNEGAFLITPTNPTIDGFDVNVPMACTFLYVAIIKN